MGGKIQCKKNSGHTTYIWKLSEILTLHKIDIPQHRNPIAEIFVKQFGFAIFSIKVLSCAQFKHFALSFMVPCYARKPSGKLSLSSDERGIEFRAIVNHHTVIGDKKIMTTMSPGKI